MPTTTKSRPNMEGQTRANQLIVLRKRRLRHNGRIEITRPQAGAALHRPYLHAARPAERDRLAHGEKAQVHGIGGRVEHVWKATRQNPPAADEVGDVGQAEDEPPARLEHAHALVERLLVEEAVLDGRVGDHDIELAIGKGHGFAIDIERVQGMPLLRARSTATGDRSVAVTTAPLSRILAASTPGPQSSSKTRSPGRICFSSRARRSWSKVSSAWLQ